MARADHRLARPFAVAIALVAVVLLAACGEGVEVNEATATIPAPDVTSPTTSTIPPVTDGAEPGDTATTSTTDADTTDTTAGNDAVPAAEPPGDLGDDEEFDALADDCFAGDFAACDRLFFESDVDSDYEAYGDSCGGRNEPGGLCANIYAQA